MELRDRLHQVALAAGAAGFGVCDAASFRDVRDDMEQRIAEGTHADLTFTYLDPARATDIRSSFAWAQRLVVVAWSYLPDGGSPGKAEAATGRIARFATEDHYAGLRRILAMVADELRGAGYQAEALSDDNRLVDRAAAVRAGIGWWGKNAMVLAPGYGPWLLLGSVATDAALPVSAPMARDCGTCTACLPACPTGALVAPGILDARKCLARWAQAPGIIPRPYRALMGDRVYGCDDCLDACPPGVRLRDRSTDRRGRVDLLQLLASSDDELLDAYGHFYLPGRRPGILRRNALVALGNAGGDGALGAAVGYLSHRSVMLSVHAAWAVWRLASPAAHRVLQQAQLRERRPEVRAEIEHALR